MNTNKTQRIFCRMTAAEYDAFCAAVAKTYLSRSEYIRRKLLPTKHPIRTRAETDWLNFVVLSLSQVNNNINQIARVMNALRHSDTVIIGSITQRQLHQVEEILREWNAFEEKFRKTIQAR